MPIYEYQCKKCGKKIDLLQRMGADKAGVPCPVCGQDALTKVLSVTAPAQMGGKGSGNSCQFGVNPATCGGGCCGGCH